MRGLLAAALHAVAVHFDQLVSTLKFEMAQILCRRSLRVLFGEPLDHFGKPQRKWLDPPPNR